MTEFEIKRPPKLNHLAPDVLAGISDDLLESALIDYVGERLSEGDDELEAVAALPSALQHWYIAFLVDAEVLNGGFNQLFFNPTGALAAEAPAAFAKIGIPAAGHLVEQAIRLLEQHAPALEAAAEAGTIEAFIESYIDQPFGQLDRQYAAAEDEWRSARLRYLRSQAEFIRHP